MEVGSLGPQKTRNCDEPGQPVACNCVLVLRRALWGMVFSRKDTQGRQLLSEGNGACSTLGKRSTVAASAITCITVPDIPQSEYFFGLICRCSPAFSIECAFVAVSHAVLMEVAEIFAQEAFSCECAVTPL